MMRKSSYIISRQIANKVLSICGEIHSKRETMGNTIKNEEEEEQEQEEDQ